MGTFFRSNGTYIYETINAMQNLGLTIDIFTAIQEIKNISFGPEKILEKVHNCLIQNRGLVGDFVKCAHKRGVTFGQHYKVHTYSMTFERRTLELEISLYRPENQWVVKTFKFI